MSILLKLQKGSKVRLSRDPEISFFLGKQITIIIPDDFMFQKNGKNYFSDYNRQEIYNSLNYNERFRIRLPVGTPIHNCCYLDSPILTRSCICIPDTIWIQHPFKFTTRAISLHSSNDLMVDNIFVKSGVSGIFNPESE